MRKNILFMVVIFVICLFGFWINNALFADVNCTGDLPGINVTAFQSEPNNPNIGDSVTVTIELTNTSDNVINLTRVRVTDEMETGVGQWHVGGSNLNRGVIAEFRDISIESRGSFRQTLPGYPITRSGQHEISMDINAGMHSTRCYAPGFYVPPPQDPRCTYDDIQVLELGQFQATPPNPMVGDEVTVTIQITNIGGVQKEIRTLRLTDEMEGSFGAPRIAELQNCASLSPHQTFSHTATYYPTIGGNHEISAHIIDELNHSKRCYITLGVRSGATPQFKSKIPAGGGKEKPEGKEKPKIKKKKYWFEKEYQYNR